MPPMVTTNFGPNLSLILPAMILKRPDKIRFNEKGSDVEARVQPKSFIMGLKKTPKLACAPETSVMIKKQAASIP
jgi:hypothetical protein